MNHLPEDQTRKVCDLLNQLLETDRVTTEQLLMHGVECFEQTALLEHPTIIVRENPETKKVELSTLGLINSVMNALGQRRVAAVVDDNTNKILSFKPYRGDQ